MRVMVVEQPGQFALSERPEPLVGAGEVLVRPLAVGICGSDIDLVQGTRPAAYVRYPIVPGHEWVAEVVMVGPGVHNVQAGTYVAVEGHNYCRVCPQCRRGATNLCIKYDEFGCTRDGGLAELVVARADLLHPFQKNLRPELAALTEPTACALHGVEVANPRLGETVVIIGTGTIALLGVTLFAQYHPRQLIVIGRHTINRDIAFTLGATHFLTGSEQEIDLSIQSLTDGVGADIIYEAAGHISAVNMAFQLARRGGHIILEGVAGADAYLTLPADLFLLKALFVHGIFAYTSAHFERALRLLEAGTITVAPLVTHRLPLQRYAEGIALLEDRKERVIKVIILPQE